MRQYFNPRSPHGERHSSSRDICSFVYISIHAPPHGERHAHQSEDDDKPHISIHAPAWGATDTVWMWVSVFDISIHAPAWGATNSDTRHTSPDNHFNPRSRMGSDTENNSKTIANTISIHAPAWGATRRRIP